MLFKNVIIIVALLVFSVVTIAMPDNHISGIGSADEVQVKIIAVANYGGVAHTYDNMYSIGTAGPVGGSNVEILVRVQYGDNVNIQDLYVDAYPFDFVSAYKSTSFLLTNSSILPPPYSPLPVTLPNGLVMHTAIYKFPFDTISPQTIYKAHVAFNASGHYNIKGRQNESLDTNLDNVMTLVSNESLYEPVRKNNLKIKVFTPNVNTDNNSVLDGGSYIFDTGQVKKVFNQGGTKNLDVRNIEFDGTQEALTIYDNDNYSRTISESTVNIFGSEYDTFYVTLRARIHRLDKNSSWKDALALTYHNSNSGFCPDNSYSSGNFTNAVAIILDRTGMDKEINDYNKKQEKKLGATTWDVTKKQNAKLNFYSAVTAHELGHALQGAGFDHCSSKNCLMYKKSSENDYTSRYNIDSWNCSSYTTHESNINTKLKLKL